jgi:hypothetical protein
MTPEQVKLAELWLSDYAEKCDRKLSPAHGNFVRGMLRCLVTTRRYLEVGKSFPDALCQADWDIWTERMDKDAMAAACFFWAMGKALKGETPKNAS